MSSALSLLHGGAGEGIDRAMMQDAEGPNVGGLAVPASMLGPLKLAAAIVLNLLIDQIKQWHNIEQVAAMLRGFETQTRGHTHLLEDLEAQLASRKECLDISKSTGARVCLYKVVTDMCRKPMTIPRSSLPCAKNTQKSILTDTVSPGVPSSCLQYPKGERLQVNC